MKPVARRGMARLAREQTSDPNGPPPRCWTEPATVASVTAGAASDGNALVTVSWRGGLYPAAYPASYSPAVGHTVLLLVQDPQIAILCRLIGTP